MMMVSFSYAINTGTIVMTVSSPPSMFQYGGVYYTSMTKGSCATTSSVFPKDSLVYQGSSNNLYSFWHITSDSYWNGSGTVVSYCTYTYSSTTTSPCPANQVLENGQCVAPQTCYPIDGKYTASDGSCVDCSSYLTAQTRASCACNAKGTSFSGQGSLAFPISSDGFAYQNSNFTCNDGTTKVSVFVNKTPLSAENNGSTPSTPIANDQLSSTLNFMGERLAQSNEILNKINNNVGDVVASTNMLNNGVNKLNTGIDKTNSILDNHSKILGEIESGIEQTVNLLSFVKDATKNSSDLLTALSVIEPVANSHNIPTSTDGGDWNTYKEAWDNTKSSFSNVNDKVTSLTGLFQNGFQLDLARGPVISCAYQTTVDFGYFQIPFEYDFCSFASPYRTIFYTFFYLLFSIAILSFSINTFLRLV